MPESNRPVMHPYHCVMDGTQCFEIGLGFIQCPKCHIQYLPTGTEDGTLEVSWKPDAPRTIVITDEMADVKVVNEEGRPLWIEFTLKEPLTVRNGDSIEWQLSPIQVGNVKVQL